MQQSVIISKQFNGPPGSGNGGYVSGLMAEMMPAVGEAAPLMGAIEASLYAPPPLERALMRVLEEDSIGLYDGTQKLGTAKPAALTLTLPDFPSAPKLAGTPTNPNGRYMQFDTCFVCGTVRKPGDGLCLHAEVVAGRTGMVATRWDIHDDFFLPDGTLLPRYIWAALDCPGYFACAFGEPALLARMTAQLYQPLTKEAAAKTPLWVYGWTLDGGDEGRKRRCGTAIVGADGTFYGAAEGLWIIVDPSKMPGTHDAAQKAAQEGQA